MTDRPVRHEHYTHGHAPATLKQHAQRAADEAAAFLLPHLRPGMRLLDVGCGPGSITRGFAERHPGAEPVAARLVGAACDHPRADYHRAPAEPRILELFDRREEGVDVDMGNPPDGLDWGHR